MRGDEPHQQPRAGAGIAHVEHGRRLGEAADADRRGRARAPPRRARARRRARASPPRCAARPRPRAARRPGVSPTASAPNISARCEIDLSPGARATPSSGRPRRGMAADWSGITDASLAFGLCLAQRRPRVICPEQAPRLFGRAIWRRGATANAATNRLRRPCAGDPRTRFSSDERREPPGREACPRAGQGRTRGPGRGDLWLSGGCRQLTGLTSGLPFSTMKTMTILAGTVPTFFVSCTSLASL